jgi:hypothetical protein
MRGARSRKLRKPGPTPFELWQQHVQDETDPDRKEALVEAGFDAGFCDREGRVIVQPSKDDRAPMFNSWLRREGRGSVLDGTKSSKEINDQIRRAAGFDPEPES